MQNAAPWTAVQGTDAAGALAEAYGRHEARRILEAGVAPLDPAVWRRLARDVADLGVTPLAGAPVLPLDQAEAQFQAALEARGAAPEDPQTLRRLALANRDLLRARQGAGDADVGLLVADLAQLMQRAAEQLPEDLELQLEYARSLQLQGRYDEQEEVARAVQRALGFALELPQDPAVFAARLSASPVTQALVSGPSYTT